MRQRSFIVLAIVIAVLGIGAVGVYAYDQSRSDIIAKGVTAGGVDLSGLKPAAAREKLKRELSAPLEKPVVVRYRGRRYKLSAAKAQVVVDTDGMAQRALAASREGNLISRTTRELTGGSIHQSIPIEVTYSRKAVAKFAKRVQRKVDRPAVDAKIAFGGGGIQKVDSRIGRKLDVAKLKRNVGAELVEPTADHRVVASVEKVKPK